MSCWHCRENFNRGYEYCLKCEKHKKNPDCVHKWYPIRVAGIDCKRCWYCGKTEKIKNTKEEK